LARLLAGNPGVEIRVANRGAARAAALLAELPEVGAASSFAEAADQADIVFLCVLPAACRETLGQVAPSLSPHSHLVSVASDVSLEMLSAFHPGRISRLIPSITSASGRGTALWSGNSQAGEAELESLRSLLGPSMEIWPVEERMLNGLSLITSCGPGIFSALFSSMEKALAKAVGLEPDSVHGPLLGAILDTCGYAGKSGLGFEEIYAQVATPGGITESGAKILRERLPVDFAEAYAAMLERHAKRSESLRRDFERTQGPAR
jgi:pyrroline-5-carboxylate reductase